MHCIPLHFKFSIPDPVCCIISLHFCALQSKWVSEWRAPQVGASWWLHSQKYLHPTLSQYLSQYSFKLFSFNLCQKTLSEEGRVLNISLVVIEYKSACCKKHRRAETSHCNTDVSIPVAYSYFWWIDTFSGLFIYVSPLPISCLPNPGFQHSLLNHFQWQNSLQGICPPSRAKLLSRKHFSQFFDISGKNAILFWSTLARIVWVLASATAARPLRRGLSFWKREAAAGCRRPVSFVLTPHISLHSTPHPPTTYT